MSFWTDPDSKRTFDGRAALYERGRPGYPAAVVDLLLHGLGRVDRRLRVADVGAGTALLTRELVARGCSVVAIEPNDEMRAAAPPVPGLEWRASTGEETGLPAGSCELVTVAQAFHWIDPERGLAEFARVLVPRGRLAIIWNDRVVESDFERAYQELLRELKPPERRDRPPRDAALALRGSSLFDEPQLTVIAHAREMDSGALLARTSSLSYAPSSGAAREELERRVLKLHRRFADSSGRTVQRYEARVHLTHAKG